MTQVLSESEYAKRQLIDVLSKDVDEFRDDARAVNKNYTRDMRKVVRGLKKGPLRADRFFQVWQEHLREQRRELATQASSVVLVRLLSRLLQLEVDQAEATVRTLVTKRDAELVRTVLSELYPGRRYASCRRNATKLLLWQEEDIEKLRIAYINHELYKAVAKDNGIVVFDPNIRWICQRLRARYMIHRQNRPNSKQESTQLAHITKRLTALGAMDNNLIDSIIEADIDVVHILAARTEYQKHIHGLSEEEIHNPLKRLSLYEDEIAELRETYGRKLMAKKSMASLSSSYDAIEAFDHIALRIFDLNNAQKNTLLRHMKEYRELSKEKEAILRTQRYRNMIDICP